MHIILNSYGAGLRRDKGNFVIKTAEAEQRLNPAQIRTISIGKGSQMTSDAVLLAIEHQIDVMFVDHSGTPRLRVVGPKNIWCELNLFYGRRGFSIVKTTKSGSHPELADLTAGVLDELLHDRFDNLE